MIVVDYIKCAASTINMFFKLKKDPFLCVKLKNGTVLSYISISRLGMVSGIDDLGNEIEISYNEVGEVNE